MLIRNFKLFENVQQSKILLDKLKIPLTDPDYLEIRDMIRGHDGYAYWLTKLRFTDKVPLEDIKNIWNIIKNESNLISYFSKPVVELKDSEAFWDEYEKAKIKYSAKSVLNQFPANQKSLFSLSNEEDVILLSQLSKSKSLLALIRKISSFRDKPSLIKAARNLLETQLSGKFDSLLNSIKETGAKIKYQDEDNDIIICSVDYPQIKKLGGDTSWCIVRSNSTFDSYASGGTQWMVFLVDNFSSNDRLSKIGITTGPFSFVTAHDKYDGFVSREKITEILKERGFNFTNLFLSKENLYEMENWDNIPVEVLLQIGATKEDIIKRKNIFKLSYGYRSQIKKRDLDLFTKEEIEKYDLINRSELDIVQLRSMTPEQIIKNNCIKRLTYKPSMSQIIELKITKDDIFNYKIFNDVSIDANSLKFFTKKEILESGMINNISNMPIEAMFSVGFKKSELISKYRNTLSEDINLILDFFEDKKTKSEIIRRLSSTLWSDDYKKLGLESNDYNNKSKFYIRTMVLFDITSKDVPLLKSSSRSISLSDLVRSEKVNNNSSFVHTLYKLGYKIEDDKSLNEFLRIVGITSTSGQYLVNYSNMLSFSNFIKEIDEVGYKLLIDLINTSIDDTIKKSNGEYNAVNIELEYYKIINLKNNILSKHPDIWKKIYDKLREGMIYMPRSFRTKESENDRSYNNDIDAKKTIECLNFFKITKEDIEKESQNLSTSRQDIIKKIGKIFGGCGVKSIDIILDYLIDLGFKFNDNEKVKVIGDIFSSYYADREVDFYKELLKRNLDKEKSYTEILKLLKEENSSNARSLIELFKGTKYEKDLNIIIDAKEKSEYYSQIRNDLGRSLSTNTYIDVTKITEWYNKNFEEYIRTKGNASNWNSREYDLKVLLILLKLDKLDDADRLELDFLNKGHGYASFHDGLIHVLSKIACNVRASFIDNNKYQFSDEQRLKLYNFIISNVDTSDIKNEYYLQVCFYLFDKKKFNDYLKKVVSLKDNSFVYVTNRATKEEVKKPITNRIKNLKYILSYFASNNDQVKFKEMVDLIFNTKMTKTETKYAINTIANTAPSDYNPNYKRENNADFKAFRDKLIASLTKEIKESNILSWKEFNRV